MTTRILIVDDHPLFRKGVRQLLSMDPELEVVGEGRSGQEALALAAQLDPDLILMDLNMAGMNGLEALKALRDAEVDCRVVMLTVSDDEDDVITALRSGADGYLLKDMEPEELLACIRQAAVGQMVLSDHLNAVLAAAISGRGTAAGHAPQELTARERDIVRCLAAGLSNKMIGRELDITEGTVKVHVKNLLKKLGLRSRVEVAVWAVNHRLD
jgi:two-component system nitrate/nitrite response regulator NarL